MEKSAIRQSSPKGREEVLAFYFYLLTLILPNIVLCLTESIVPPGKAALILVPLALYWLLMSLSRLVHRTYLLLLPLLFLGAFNIVLSYLFGKGVIAVDMWLNLATTSGAEAGEMLSQIYPSVVAVVVIYVPALSYAAWRVSRGYRPLARRFLVRQRIVAALLGVAGLGVLGGALSQPRYSFLNDMFPVNVCYNLTLAVQRQVASTRYPQTSANFRYEAVSADTLPDEVIVMVVGETSRAANWQLCGYSRPTNPELSRLDGVVSYSDCLSQSNTTHKSVPILLTPATAEDYDVLYRSKGVCRAFAEAGFHTVFLSNEPRNHSFNDHLGEEAADVMFLRDTYEGDPMDTLLLPLIRQKLQSSRGRTLLVVHTYGSHSTYSDRYTRRQAYFQPDKVVKATRDNRHILINAYDNTIRLTDRFLASVIRDLQASGRPAALLYTSDHGEDIYDDRRNLYLHASPTPSYYQLHVPLVAWTSPSYAAAYPQRVAQLRAHRSKAVQTDCIFPTLLTLGGIATPYGQPGLSLASPAFKEKPLRHYLTDHNRAVPLSECFEELDFQAMRTHGLKEK